MLDFSILPQVLPTPADPSNLPAYAKPDSGTYSPGLPAATDNYSGPNESRTPSQRGLPGVADFIAQNIKEAAQAAQTANGYNIEGAGEIVKNGDVSTLRMPKGYADDPKFWEWAKNNPEKTKELYQKVLGPLRDNQPGPIPFQVTSPDGGVTMGTYDENGVVRMVSRTGEQQKSLVREQQFSELNAFHKEAVNALDAEVKKSVGSLELSNKAQSDALATLVTATKEFGKVARDIYASDADLNNVVADQIKIAGFQTAARVEQQRAALADPANMKKAQDIFSSNLDFIAKVNAKRDEAQATLDKLNANPFMIGASVVYGGADKNPILVGAKTSVDQLVAVSNNAAVAAENMLRGMQTMQSVAERQFLVQTPEEVLATTAMTAAKFKETASKSTLQGAGTYVTEANALADSTKIEFDSKLKIAKEALAANIAKIQGAKGMEVVALQGENIRLKEFIAKMENDRKYDLAEMKAEGIYTPEQTQTAIQWAVGNGAKAEDLRTVAAMTKQGKSSADPNYKNFLDMKNSALPSSLRMAAAAELARSGTFNLDKVDPSLRLTVDPRQNGYQRYIQVQGIQDQIILETKRLRGDKYSKSDQDDALKATQEALAKSIQNPEDPVKAIVKGTEITISAASPTKVVPGEFIPLAGANQDAGVRAGITDEEHKRLLGSRLAQAVAKRDLEYQQMPADANGRMRAGYKDVFQLGAQIRLSDPTYTLEQFASEVQDIYSTGVHLTAKYLNPEAFGLPAQKGYVVNIEKEKTGSTVMGVLGAVTARTMLDLGKPNVGLPLINPTMDVVPINLTKSVAEVTKTNANIYFRLNNQNAFSALRGLESIDLTNKTQFMTYIKQVDAKAGLWDERK